MFQVFSWSAAGPELCSTAVLNVHLVDVDVAGTGQDCGVLSLSNGDEALSISIGNL